MVGPWVLKCRTYSVITVNLIGSCAPFRFMRLAESLSPLLMAEMLILCGDDRNSSRHPALCDRMGLNLLGVEEDSRSMDSIKVIDT